MNKKIILAVAILMVFCGAGAIGYVAAQNQKAAAVVSKNDAATGQEADGEEDTGLTVKDGGETYTYNPNLKTFLFLGVDKTGEVTLQENAGRGGQSDCIILFVLDKVNKTTTMLEISRDSMVDIDIYGISGDYVATEKAQLATQYAYGDGEKRSCWLTRKKVTELMGDHVRIDGYISLNIAGIATLNDAMGGVSITVPEDYTAIDPLFAKGATITLTGEQAESYVRSRDSDVTGSNVARMERQTQYLEALFTQMQGKLDTATITRLQSSASPYLVTDLTLDEMKQMGSYTMNETVYTVPGITKEGAEHDEFEIDHDGLQKIIQEIFYNHEK